MVNSNDIFLDCKNIKCPMPIIKVSRAIKDLASGQILLVEATDPAFKPDLEVWLQQMKHKLLSFEDGPVSRARIEKS